MSDSVLSSLAEAYSYLMRDIIVTGLRARWVMLNPFPFMPDDITRTIMSTTGYRHFLGLQDDGFPFIKRPHMFLDDSKEGNFEIRVVNGDTITTGASSRYRVFCDNDVYPRLMDWVANGRSVAVSNCVTAQYIRAALSNATSWPQLIRACPLMPKVATSIYSEVCKCPDFIRSGNVSVYNGPTMVRNMQATIDHYTNAGSKTAVDAMQNWSFTAPDGEEFTPRKALQVINVVLQQLLLLRPNMREATSASQILAMPIKYERLW